MGKFKPVKLGGSILVFSVIIIFIVGFSIIDDGLALQFAPPELRVVGGCFRDCLDPEQTGFGGQDPVPDPEPITVIEVDVETGETVECDGEVDFNGTITVTDPNCKSFVEPPPEEEPEPEVMCQSNEVLGSDGKCKTITLKDSEGQEFNIFTVDDTVACWLNVHANVLDADGNIIGTEASRFFMVSPVPQLSVTDTATGVEFDAGSYELFPMLKCATNEQGGVDPDSAFSSSGFFDFPSFTTPLKLESTEIQFRVYSVFEDQLIETYNAPITIPEKEITSAEAIDIGLHTIQTENLLKFLPSGDYDSFQHIALEGKLVLHWNTGDPKVDNVPQIIELRTGKTFTDGKLTSVENPVMIFRELTVSKDVTEEPPEKMDCPEGQVPFMGDPNVCVNVGGDGCGDNAVRINGVCVQITNGGVDPKNPSVENIVDRFLTCLDSGDPNCFASTEFLPFYLIGVGGIIVVVGLGQRATRQPDIYGVPRGF